MTELISLLSTISEAENSDYFQGKHLELRMTYFTTEIARE
jgi:hypothetical protein